MGTSGVPRMEADELRDGGYLQEANRRFFHRLGMALALVPVDSDQPGDRAGWDLVVLDDRGDPEGWYFDGVPDMAEKAAKVDAEMAARLPARLAALGYDVQPVDG